MRHSVGTRIVLAFCTAMGATPALAASPYDGTWSGRDTGGGNCAGTVGTLTVKDGVVVSGGVQGAMANGTYRRVEIGPDGKATLITSGGRSVEATFTADHFEIRGRALCGDLLVTGTRTGH